MTDRDHDTAEKGLALRVRALEELLVEQGLVDAAALDRIVEAYETRIGPRGEGPGDVGSPGRPPRGAAPGSPAAP